MDKIYCRLARAVAARNETAYRAKQIQKPGKGLETDVGGLC